MTGKRDVLAGGADVSDVELDTAEGPMRAIMAWPRKRDPIAAVITFPHVGGLTDTMRTMARMVAHGGYACLVPDLYHRLGTIVLDPQSTNEHALAIRKAAAASVTQSSAMIDLDAALCWLRRAARLPPPYGAIGYGRGGSFALAAAALRHDEIGAAASILGFGFTGNGSEAARRMLPGITGEIYCAFAENDEIIPSEVPDELSAMLAELPLRSRLVVHQGASHPYIFPDRKVHDAAAAAEDWASIFAMFERRLMRPKQQTGS